ncbi:hypothetical protein [Xylella fastidiosa]|uniref:hypothetical protein n=1 Tax=Xylella fastidiosa TaxID=2371 RepID=UPI003985103D
MRIAEKLAAEREGVSAWIVAGAVEWYKNGLRPPEIVLAASEDYKEEQDRVGQFIDEECELGVEKEEKLSTRLERGGFYPSAYAPLQGQRRLRAVQSPCPLRIGTARTWV